MVLCQRLLFYDEHSDGGGGVRLHITSCSARVDIHVAHRLKGDINMGKYATTRV